MQETIEYTHLDDALRRCGASWNAAQAHGLLCGCLTHSGRAAIAEWLTAVQDSGDSAGASAGECVGMLETLSAHTWLQLAERQSRFEPLLPGDDAPAASRAAALAHWCEGYLHGLVSAEHAEGIQARLAAEPLADIIRDMLEITRATVDSQADEESNEQAWTELVEYIRVAVQLAYEELAEIRPGVGNHSGRSGSDTLH